MPLPASGIATVVTVWAAVGVDSTGSWATPLASACGRQLAIASRDVGEVVSAAWTTTTAGDGVGERLLQVVQHRDPRQAGRQVVRAGVVRP